jgi:hypothetical protein
MGRKREWILDWGLLEELQAGVVGMEIEKI